MAAGSHSGRYATGRKRLRVRREAGQWLRTRVGRSARAMLAARSAIGGLAAGAGLAGFLGWQSAVALVAVLASVTLLRIRRYETERFTRLLKGGAAERFVGGLVERATTARGCAVAHSVTKIAEVGDIDHLVATCGTLWVLETKYATVPNDRFAEVLRRISVNVAAVQRWAPPGVPVRGCLVLATAGAPPRNRVYEDGRVEVFDPRSLAVRLRRESAKRPEKQGPGARQAGVGARGHQGVGLANRRTATSPDRRGASIGAGPHRLSPASRSAGATGPAPGCPYGGESRRRHAIKRGGSGVAIAPPASASHGRDADCCRWRTGSFLAGRLCRGNLGGIWRRWLMLVESITE